MRYNLVIVERGEQVQASAPDIYALAAIDMGGGGAIVTAAGRGDTDYVCRFFAPSAGISEDPFTGSIQCTVGPFSAETLGKERLRVKLLSPRGAMMESVVVGDRVRIVGNAALYLE